MITFVASKNIVMKIRVDRAWKRPEYVISRFIIDGMRVCECLEDADRGLRQDMSETTIRRDKIYGRTAIPTGRYRIDMETYSPKFGCRSFYKEVCNGMVPRLVDVPGYEGVLVHAGNTCEDTQGCLLTGENKVKGKVVNSQATFRRVYKMMKEAHDRGEEIWITVG